MSNTVTVDMATALELPLGVENEAKFVALRNLHMKKIKQLMASVDLKDKEISKLKVTSKDNRRTQMIQALRNKLKDLELVNDVIKAELAQKAELTAEQVNELVMRKTLGGPKRFRPLTREELENKIYKLESDLERKATRKEAAPVVPDSDAKGDDTYNAQAKPSARGGRAEDVKDRSNAVSEASLLDTASMLEEIQQLRTELRTKETVNDRQHDEISRLRSRNAELVSAEEEVAFFEQQQAALEENNALLAKTVQELTAQAADALEMANKHKYEATLIAEHDQVEVTSLQAECEKLLKQNTSLLQSLSEAENTLRRTEQERTLVKELGAAAENSAISKDSRIRSLEEKLQRAEERLKQTETKCTALEAEAAQVTSLKNQLREKNIQLKDMKRNADERERILQLKGGETTTAGSPAAVKMARDDKASDEGKEEK